MRKYIRPDLFETMKSSDFNPPINELGSKKINFMLVAVSGIAPNDIGKNIGVVVETAKQCGWPCEYIFSGLVVLVDGPTIRSDLKPMSYQTLLTKIANALEMQCKSLGGEQVVPWGHYGSAYRLTFGAMLPNFLGLVAQLHKQSFGTHASI